MCEISLTVVFAMQELGVSTNANYKITFMLDSAAMITVHTPRRGLIDVRFVLIHGVIFFIFFKQ